MADTTFFDGVTKIVASWLNDVNDSVYGTLQANNPIWLSIPTQNWTVGDVISFDLNPYVRSPDDSAITFAEVGDNLPKDLTLVAGVVTGTIATLQGGTYEVVVSATNSTGTPITNVLPAIVVGLGITAPIIGTIPNVSYDQGAQIIPINLNDYVTFDGNPVGTETLTWELDDTSDALPMSLNFYSVGIISGAVNLTATDTTYAIAVIATNASNSTLISNIGTFTFTVTVVGASVETPVVGRWDSGQSFCTTGAVAPTWISGAAFTKNASDGATWTVDLNTYIANEGSSAIKTDGTGWAVIADNLPTGVTLDDTTGIVSGIQDGTVLDPAIATTFQATNSEATSDTSPDFTWTVTDDTVIVPVLTSIDAEAGTNFVFANFSIPVKAASETAAAYILGCTVEVNPVTPAVTRTITSASNFSSNRIRYTVDGAAFSAEQTLRFSYDKALGGLVSVDNSVEVETTVAPDFQIPIVHEGVLYQTGFEQSEGISLGPLPTTTQTNNFSWTLATTVYVDDGRAKTGSQSLLFPFLTQRKEKRMNIGTDNKEIWFSYDIYIPSNYYHDNVSGTDNNKFFAIWGGGQAGYDGQYRDGPLLIFELHLLSGQPDTDFMRLLLGTRVDNVVTHSGYFNVSNNPGEDGSGLLIRPTDKGHWMNVTMHMKYATKADWISRTGGDSSAPYTRGDGIVELWKTDWTGNVDKVIDLNIVPMYANNSITFEEAEGFDSAHLWGANNAEFAEWTGVYVDNFVVSASPLNGFTGY